MLLSCTGTVSAKEIMVGPGYGNTTITAALANASNGDIITVTDGTYTENVDVAKEVTIRSQNGPSNTNIKASSSSDHIFYVNVDNVTISGFNITGASGSLKAGIYLDGASGCTLTNNTASNNTYGIFLYSNSDNNTLTGNTASNNSDYGIYLYSSDSNTFTNNTASNNSNYGIYLYYNSDNNTLTNNTAINNSDHGIRLDYSASNTLTNNTASDNNYGILLYHSDSNTLTGNIMSQNDYNLYISGSSLTDYLNDIDTSNLVNSKPVYYLTNSSDAVVPSNAGVVYAINCTNVSMQDINITNEYGGVLFYETDNSTIENATISECYGGIGLSYSASNTLTGNTANDNNYGIILESSASNTLTGNTASNNSGRGIYLYSNSASNTLTGNTASNNSDYGIYLSSSASNTLTDNTAMNNTRYGMYFSSSDNNTLTSNDANYNGRYGIYLSSSNNNTLTDNVASYNTYTYIEPASMSVGSIVEPMDISGGPATGIFIGYSDYNVLNGNTANYNEGSNGVLMASNSNAVSPNVDMGSDYSCGFSLYRSENTTLTGNTAIGNDDYEFYSRSSTNCTIDNLEIDTGSMELSFVPIYDGTAIRSNETISTGPSGKANVNGYLDIGLLEDMNMTIFYDDSGMSSSIESSVTLYKLNGNEWVAVPNATLNTSGNFVSVNLDSGVSVDIASIADHTSTYGLFRNVPSSSSRPDDDGVRASVSQGQNPAIVSNSASSVKRITGGSEVNYDFSDSGTPVLGVSFDAKDDKGLVVAKVQVLSSTPEGVPSASGNSYQMMSIDVGSEGTISSDSADNVMIHFKVSKQWIEENNIDLSTIRMTRYHGEQWNDLPTTQENEDGEYFYFYAETPGFSIFEVVGDEIGETSEQDAASTSVTEEVEEPVEEKETKDTPGFTILAGIMFVSFAVLVRKR
ncbi:right-handed parallel beta-helix repeat-containing protein [uncultured Methanolobus sp.]|uniref:right-handed parallel beta-helix repeat-containing protein n=1 Tax=uncultured Methanolobus sp. TaxID=218300 RepID=UPI002AAADD03|nr:right-handed parallel beta-helix repeat-containing protein [uncultured Methanolobus sp.]